jgi:hypothetical protein
MIALLHRSSTRVVDWIVPRVDVPGRRRSYHLLLWVLCAGLAVHVFIHVPSEYATPVGVLVVLILAARRLRLRACCAPILSGGW